MFVRPQELRHEYVSLAGISSRRLLTLRRMHYRITASALRPQGDSMVDHNRRTIAKLSLGGLAALCAPPSLLAATQCVTGPLPGFLPNSLTVDCASKRNFRTFRQYSDYLGLAGVVSMTTVRGKYGSYQAGNLF